MQTRPEQEIENLKGKINALSGVLRLGHEAFQKADPAATASHIVNNSRLLIDYGRSCVVDLRGLSPAILAVNGQAMPKQDSEYCAAARRLAAAALVGKEMKSYKASALDGVSPEEAEALSTIFSGHSKGELLLLPLSEPGAQAEKPGFLWAVEFFEGAPAHAPSVLGLLSQHYAEALWHKAVAKPGMFDAFLKLKDLPPVKIALWSLLSAAVLLCVIRVRQYAVADFEIAPAAESVCYSQLAGTLKKVIKANGEKVKQGDEVLAFDADELNFKLAEATKDFEQVSAELDATRQKSFASPDLIAKSQLLEIKREQDKIEMEKTRWMLSKSLLKAPVAGVVVMEDKEKMEGKAARPGDKLFEIIPPESLIAEIALSERDASVIGKGMTVSLYLHTQPETPVKGEIVSVAPKPILTDDRKFCYIIKFKPASANGLICGMRGVARVGGERVSLGYHIFRSALLWWRKI